MKYRDVHHASLLGAKFVCLCINQVHQNRVRRLHCKIETLLVSLKFSLLFKPSCEMRQGGEAGTPTEAMRIYQIHKHAKLGYCPAKNDYAPLFMPSADFFLLPYYQMSQLCAPEHPERRNTVP